MPPRFLLLSKFPWSNLRWIVLLRGLLHWLDLVILGLSHCYPMVTRLVLLSSQTYPMQKLKLNLVLFHLLGIHVHQPGIASLLHWLDLVREMILGKLQSFSQTHLVLLSLGHCHPMDTLLVEMLLYRRHYRQSDSNKKHRGSNKKKQLEQGSICHVDMCIH